MRIAIAIVILRELKTGKGLKNLCGCNKALGWLSKASSANRHGHVLSQEYCHVLSRELGFAIKGKRKARIHVKTRKKQVEEDEVKVEFRRG